jgi:hypothetical protein
MRRWLWLCALLLVISLPVQAQTALKYGAVVTDDMTADDYEFAYTFVGDAGDVILVAMEPVDVLGDLDETQLRLLDAEGEVLVEDDSFGRTVIFAVLPDDGEYTLIATRPDGVEGSAVGEFTLQLALLPEVEIGSSIRDTVTNRKGDHYYVYRGAADFYLTYRKTGGDFGPEVSVNQLDDPNEDGRLEVVGALRGSDVQMGSMGVFPGEALYIIRLGEAVFDFYFGDVTADYQLDILNARDLE